MPPWLTETGTNGEAVGINDLVFRLVAAFVFGCVAAFIYALTKRFRGGPEFRSFLSTLILLSVLIALVTLVIGNSIARAFSLAGALAIVRFRTVVEDTRDTAFVIFAVILGMAAGTRYFDAPLITIPLVLVGAWLFRPPATVKPDEGTLILRLASGRLAPESLEGMLREHLASHRLTGLATARGGVALDVTYAVVPRGESQSLALVTALTQMEGVQGVELKM